MWKMGGNLQKNLDTVALATQSAIGQAANHNAVVKQFGRELNSFGIKFQYEKPVISGDGKVCHPDLDIIEKGKTVAHVEIKTGRRCNIDMEQIRKYQDGKYVYLIHFKADGSAPSVDKY